jgi:hypothetical protein
MYPEELIGVELFKVFNETETHHGFHYEEGVLNRLKEPFSRTGSCVRGGFYFTTKEHISKFLSFGNHVRRVHVPFDHPDVKVVRDPEGNKYRTNMLMLGKKCTVEELCSMMSLLDILVWKAIDRSEVFYHWNRLGKPGMSEISMDTASVLGLVDVLEWWKNSGRDCKWSDFAMDGASELGHVKVLEWWKNSGLECKWSDKAINRASRGILEWWKNSGLMPACSGT